MGKGPQSGLEKRDSDERTVDQFIARVNTLWRRSLIDAVVAVGDDLIDTFFGGDLDLARSYDPRKPVALARLYERADELPISAHALRRAIRLSVQYRELPSSVRGALSVRHQIALLPVADVAAKVKLGEQAVARQLTSDQLTTVVREQTKRRGRDKAPGRPVLPALVKHMAALDRTARAAGIAQVLSPGALRTLEPAAITTIERQLRFLREHVEQITDALARRGRGA